MKRLALALLIAALAFTLQPPDRYTTALDLLLAGFLFYGVACAIAELVTAGRRRFR